MAEMERGVQGAARLVRAGRDAWERRSVFFALCLFVFVASTGTLMRLDLLPEEKVAEAAPPLEDSGGIEQPVALPEYPVRITAEAINLEVRVENPTSVVINVLDAALLRGAVRYPTSARLGEDGNVVIFGHSSYLPVVTNQNFKAFNGIQKLKAGDRITVESESRVYIYEVESVREASATEDGIPLAILGKKLTLATCDSFGAPSDRFIVVSNFVESRALPQAASL